MSSSQPLGLPPIDPGQPAADPATLAPLPPLQAVGPGLSLPPAVAGNLPSLTPAPLGHDGETGDLAFLDQALAARQAAAPGQVTSSMPGTQLTGGQNADGTLPQVITVGPGGAGAGRATGSPQGSDALLNPEELRRQTAAQGKALEALAKVQEKARAAESQAINSAAEVAKQQNAAELEVRKDAQTAQDALDAQHAQKQTFFQAERDKASDAVGKAIDEANKTPFDENHYVHSLGAGGTALTLLSVALGGVSQAYNGGPNVGLQMLNAAIDRDIDAQKYAYQKKRQTVADKQSVYARLREGGLDEQQAYQGAALVASAKLSTALNVITAQYGGPRAEAQRQMLQAALGERAATAQGQLLQMTNGLAAQKWGQGIALAQVEALGNKGNGMAGYAPFLNKQAELAQLTVPGWQGHAKTPEMYSTAVKGKKGFDTYIKILHQLREIRKTHNRANVLDRGPINRVPVLQASGTVAGKNLDELGALSGGDTKLEVVKLPDPTSLTTTDAAFYAAIDQAERDAKNTYNDGMRAVGYTPPGTSGSDTGDSNAPVPGDVPIK